MKQLKTLFWAVSACLLVACQTESARTAAGPADDVPLRLSVSEGIKNNNRGFDSLGYRPGQKVPDLTLFSADGVPLSLSEALDGNKALLLISGSYTCDISRLNVPDINALAARYRNRLNICLVYTLEAHPSDVPGPYANDRRVKPAPANVRDGIAARQPRTYGERKQLARKWKDENYLLPPVFIDSPANEFWSAFGQAPNVAYLIEPGGEVLFRQTWFSYPALNGAIRQWLQTSDRSQDLSLHEAAGEE